MDRPESDKRSLRILLVEDDEVDAESVRRRARIDTDDLEVVHVAYLDKALKSVTRSTFDVALLDLRLPGVDGLDGLRTLRQAEPHLPIVVVTGVDRSLAIEALRVGADEYLPKSELAAADLGRLISQAMERRRTWRQLEQSRSVLEHSLTAMEETVGTVRESLRPAIEKLARFARGLDIAIGGTETSQPRRELGQVLRRVDAMVGDLIQYTSNLRTFDYSIELNIEQAVRDAWDWIDGNEDLLDIDPSLGDRIVGALPPRALKMALRVLLRVVASHSRGSVRCLYVPSRGDGELRLEGTTHEDAFDSSEQVSAHQERRLLERVQSLELNLAINVAGKALNDSRADVWIEIRPGSRIDVALRFNDEP